MFWSKPKSPITTEDEEWTEGNLNWLIDEFKDPKVKTITPSKEFFDYKFTGQQKDAEYILETVKKLMDVQSNNFELKYFSEHNEKDYQKYGVSKSEGLNDSFEYATGTYQETESGPTIISIETRQLKNPVALIATISHELAHHKLLGENRIEENDEFLTDLTAIFFGFGIFLNNSKFNFSQWQDDSHQGWAMNTSGYLPKQIINFAIAYLNYYRQDETDVHEYLDKEGSKIYKKSLKYLWWLMKQRGNGY
jgi:hypothetical protein